jgi:hypothetical protein
MPSHSERVRRNYPPPAAPAVATPPSAPASASGPSPMVTTAETGSTDAA